MSFISLKWKPRARHFLRNIEEILKKGDCVYQKGVEFYLPYSNKKNETLKNSSLLKPLFPGHIALLWDGSYLFGLMAFWQLKQLGIPFSVITAKEIKEGILKKHHLLLVPGGWTTPKNIALGEEGRRKIKEFIKQGGNYLGICGGSGLALNERDGLGLLPVSRKRDRSIANFYGKIKLKQLTPHPLWEGIPAHVPFSVFWPALFDLEDRKAITILACYQDITPNFFVTDLNITDLKEYDELEKWQGQYQLKIDPIVLKEQPAIIEGKYGKGKVILSYPHLDTPDNPWEALALFNLCHCFFDAPFFLPSKPLKNYGKMPKSGFSLIKKLMDAIREFIQFGQRNFLWYWHTPWLLHWRKGIRGFHYLSLYLLIKEIKEYSHKKPLFVPPHLVISSLDELIKILLPFLEEIKSLLLKQRYLLNNKPLSLDFEEDETTNYMQTELFGKTPAYGGRFKEILNHLDKILIPFVKADSYETSLL
jgi:glutamine amidotransferase-like uncharacterized protein